MDEVKLDQVRGWLEKLGAMTPDEIARFLAEEKCTGWSSGLHCPIANFLREKTGLEVLVDGYQVQVGHSLGPTIRAPQSVDQFVDMFDGHEYPELTAVDNFQLQVKTYEEFVARGAAAAVEKERNGN